MNKQSTLRRFLTNIYGYSFFNSLVFLYPLYTIFLAENGMTETQISTLFIIWCLGTMIAQVPVGILADKISRKSVIVIGQIAKISCFLIWLAFPTFWGFALGFVLWGLQGAVHAAIFEALVYDELNARMHKQTYTKICGRKNAISNVSYLMSTAGSFMAFMGYDVITYISGAALLLSALFILRIRPAAKVVRKKNVQFMKTIKLASNVMKKVPYVLYIMIFCTALTAFSVLDDYFGLIGVDIGISKEYVGIIYFVATVFIIFGQTIAHKFEKISDWKLYASSCLVGILIVAFAWFYSIWALALIGVAYLIASIVRVLVYARFQHAVPSAYRSTVLSLYSFCEQIMWIMAYAIVFFGGLMGGWRYGVILLGMMCVIVGMWALLFIQKPCYKTDGITVCLPQNKCSI